MVWACGKRDEYRVARRVLIPEVVEGGYEVDRG